ncbi:MAG: cytochrome C oxidase subunit I [Bacteroidetes bacterium]|nr:cytochrome C oxidase subunit I [Bacteroidota bacterium]
MVTGPGNMGLSSTTSYKVVIPFYIYAALSFFVACILLVISIPGFTTNYFQPNTLAITHTMALGWGTMIILGASHQLVPVMIENKLYSNFLAWCSFIFAAIGIPLLIYGFLVFNMGWPAQWGAHFIVSAIIVYCINLAISMAKSKHENVHAFFVLTATLWLLATTIIGLLLVYNFTKPFLSENSITYLPMHAHIGIVGWFLLLVMGVGSRLIPMFLISKYHHTKKLWWIYVCINAGLIIFIADFIYLQISWLYLLTYALIVMAILLFANFCYHAYKERIRKKVDEPMKVSLLSVIMMLLPLLFLCIIIILLLSQSTENIALIISYGFIIFFGWITAIILGMTFKTLPFIVWNKVYHHLAGKQKTPNPKDLFNITLFKWMAIFYILGFIIFLLGVFMNQYFILQTGAVFLLVTSILYNLNVFKLLTHKPTKE